jgi:hypothetical protein
MTAGQTKQTVEFFDLRGIFLIMCYVVYRTGTSVLPMFQTSNSPFYKHFQCNMQSEVWGLRRE